MKRILFALLILLFSISPLISWSGGYTIPCYACIENTLYKNRGYSFCMGCDMWRCYRIADKDAFKGYMVYRCKHGHCILIPLKSENKSRDLNEIIIYREGEAMMRLCKELIEKYTR